MIGIQYPPKMLYQSGIAFFVVIVRKEMESIADKSAKTQKLMLYKKLLYYIFILRGGGLKNIWIKMKRWYSPDNNKKSL